MTIKEILTANRDSVISSIKYVFKIWKMEDVKKQMVNFLAFAEQHANVEELAKSKRVKTDLRLLVIKMKNEQEKADNLRRFGKEKPSLADIMAYSARLMEDEGAVWHPIYKTYVKRENAFSSMAKYPKFVNI
jgi:hypothetical protein